MSSGRERFMIVFGALLSASSLVLCAVVGWNIARNLSFWATKSVVVANFVLCLLLFLAAIWGVRVILGRRSEKTFHWNLLFLVYLALTPLLAEAVLRIGIAVGPDAFREPKIYADRFAESDYFKLATLWNPRSAEKRDNLPSIAYDPLLGWSFPRTAENPLGVFAAIPYEVDTSQKPVLFYGDSFTLHGEPIEEKVPQLLDSKLPGQSVYNYGIGGYGLDQIYLRFRDSHPLFEDPLILFGFLTTDIDRALLEYRDAPKPHFEVEGDGLKLVPVGPENSNYLEENPPQLKSYVLAAFKRTVRYLLAGGSSAESAFRREEKKRLASRLFEEVVAEARDHDLDLVFVVFSPRGDGGWRRAFIDSEFARLGVESIDVETILLEAEARAGRGRRGSFDETGHHSPWANRVIADGIYDYLAATGRVEAPPRAPAAETGAQGGG